MLRFFAGNMSGWKVNFDVVCDVQQFRGGCRLESMAPILETFVLSVGRVFKFAIFQLSGSEMLPENMLEHGL